MSWWGKLAGGGIGFALGGPLGAMLGTILGHQIDKVKQQGFDPGSQERTQAAFFSATFSVMGHIAKADGHVSPQEIQMAEQVITQMKLSQEQRQAAIALFNQGKQSDFDLDQVLDQFKQECGRKITLIQMFMQIQLQAAYADGSKDLAEEEILRRICQRLGYPVKMLAQLEAILFAQQGQYNSTAHAARDVNQLNNAYSVLGISKESSEAEIKRAYRKLMSQNHPDKLIAKGLPDEMIQIATDKAKEIQKAYELIKEARKLNAQ